MGKKNITINDVAKSVDTVACKLENLARMIKEGFFEVNGIINAGFAMMNKHFDRIDKHFDQIEAIFDNIERKCEATKQRLGNVVCDDENVKLRQKHN